MTYLPLAILLGVLAFLLLPAAREYLMMRRSITRRAWDLRRERRKKQQDG